MEDAMIVLKFVAKNSEEAYSIMGGIRRLMKARGKMVTELSATFQETLK